MTIRDNKTDAADGIDASKRETLRKLAASAWKAPAVASFALASLSVSSTSALAGSSTSSSFLSNTSSSSNT